MFNTPIGLTLGEYSDDFRKAIEKHGGKLGVLELIASAPQIYNKLYEEAEVAVFNHLNPIIIGDKATISSEEHSRLLEQMRFLDRKNGLFDLLGNGTALIRVSSPGDFRSFVDIFPTDVIHDLSIDSINKAILDIKTRIHKIKGDILKYANGTGVPYNEADLSFGVVGRMDVPIITATENPNSDDIFLDDYQGENAYGKTIYSEIDTTEKPTHVGKKIRKALELLREEGVLDKNIAYQLELGQLYHGTLVLFQIKEFTKKVPLITSVRGSIGFLINKVLSGSDIGDYSIPIVYSKYPEGGFESAREREDNIALSLGYNNSRNLHSDEYSPNVVGLVHGDAHGGTLNHNSFRMAQASLQRGGFALLGTRFSDILEDRGLSLSNLEAKFSDGNLRVTLS